MYYEELDESTRRFMLNEYNLEAGKAGSYISKNLSRKGKEVFPQLFREAIKSGDQETLFESLNKEEYWLPMQKYTRDGETKERKVNVKQAATQLALTEFSTLYVLGLSKKLLEEGETECQIYRGAEPKHASAECEEHEGQTVPLQDIYNNHRKRYWPEPGDKTLLAIPYGPNCHHLIRRVKK